MKLEHFLNSDLNVLSRIRHHNLVEVVGSFWPGEQFVALVTKFESVVINEQQVSSKVDVYNFGVILMEIMTRGRPTIGLFSEGGEKVNLRQWVEFGMNGESVVALVDPALAENMSERKREKIINLLKLSLLCAKERPEERPSMSQVLSWLVNIKQDRMDCDFAF
ncbi:hypothetical protein SUGI_0683260 [Cryptomeria japonica]|nr:hypothetical protein SUGI_0683260 [Cryptomeria japonica]